MLRTYRATNVATNSLPDADVTLRGKKVSAALAVTTNFDELSVRMGDTALCTNVYFLAGKNEGGYHENMDMNGFFIWMIRLERTWPEWMKQLQCDKDEGKLSTPHDFYDFDLERRLRRCILFIDGAPYHLAILQQLGEMNKEEIADLLRSQNIEHIQFTHYDKNGEAINANCEVPEEGKTWARGYPNTDQVREGAHHALLFVNPELIERPWYRIARRVQNKWGPVGCKKPSLDVKICCPYTSPWWPIELRWALEKGALANPINLKENRSVAEAVEILINASHKYEPIA